VRGDTERVEHGLGQRGWAECPGRADRQSEGVEFLHAALVKLGGALHIGTAVLDVGGGDATVPAGVGLPRQAERATGRLQAMSLPCQCIGQGAQVDELAPPPPGQRGLLDCGAEVNERGVRVHVLDLHPRHMPPLLVPLRSVALGEGEREAAQIPRAALRGVDGDAGQIEGQVETDHGGTALPGRRVEHLCDPLGSAEQPQRTVRPDRRHRTGNDLPQDGEPGRVGFREVVGVEQALLHTLQPENGMRSVVAPTPERQRLRRIDRGFGVEHRCGSSSPFHIGLADRSERATSSPIRPVGTAFWRRQIAPGASESGRRALLLSLIEPCGTSGCLMTVVAEPRLGRVVGLAVAVAIG
jgi:hypothetical protein